MGRCCGQVVAAYTVLSICGLAWRMNVTLQKARQDGGFTRENAAQHAEGDGLLQSLLQSSLTTSLLANLLVNCVILVAFSTKALFFGELSLMETQKLVERLINYVIFKGLFLALIAWPDMMKIAIWLVWFTVLGLFKMFQGLAKDRLERLNASPAATVSSHVRILAVLVLVLLSDMLWIRLCLLIFKEGGLNTLLLLLFEPLSIAFDILQVVLVHGMQLLDTRNQHINDMAPQCTGLQPSERSAAGAAWEWRGTVVRNCSFVMDIVSLLLALSHCLHIWWLRGLAFQVIDGVLFLNLRALLSAILKRIKGFIRVRKAMNTLQGALPDATEEELLAYDDDCAICKEPMARAKRLPCAHLFHLPCLRSWLDQGLAENYTCPTCRRPLFMRCTRAASSSLQSRQHFDEAQTAGTVHGVGHRGPDDSQMVGNSSQRASPNLLMGSFSRQQWDAALNNTWRGSEMDAAWADSLPVGATERDGSSADSGTRSLGRMQILMRHLSGSSRSYSQNESDEARWSGWPFTNRIRGTSSVQLAGNSRHRLDASSFNRHPSFRNHGHNPGLMNTADLHLVTMVTMVREVLPDIPEDIIVQDLQRTNSVTTTVNNLL